MWDGARAMGGKTKIAQHGFAQAKNSNGTGDTADLDDSNVVVRDGQGGREEVEGGDGRSIVEAEAIQLLEYQTDVRRCRFDKPSFDKPSSLLRPYIADTSALSMLELGLMPLVTTMGRGRYVLARVCVCRVRIQSCSWVVYR